MVGKWLVVLPLLVNFNKVILQPITQVARQLDLSNCCPCPDFTKIATKTRSHDTSNDDFKFVDDPCRLCGDDTEASASILMPALRAMQPFVETPDQKTEPKPLLQPEVGLASSVLETLRQVTDEEYEEALARDAARSAVKLIESTLNPIDDSLSETPKNKVSIYINTKGDDKDDNLPESSHIQETRCIHSPLKSIQKNGQLRVNRPIPLIEITELSPTPWKTLKNKRILHKKIQNMDNGIGASNIQERIIKPNLDTKMKNVNLKSNPSLFNLFKYDDVGKQEYETNLEKNTNDESNLNQKIKPNIHLKLRELLDNLEVISNRQKTKVPVIDLKKYVSFTTLTPPLKLNPIEKLIRNDRPLVLKDLSKLKDVELISQNLNYSKNTAARKSSYPDLKLWSENSKEGKFNVNYEDVNNNLLPNKNKVVKMTLEPRLPNIADAETSPINLIPVYELKSETIGTSVNGGVSDILAMPMELEDHNNSDFSEVMLKEDSNKEECKEPIENTFIQEIYNNKTQKQLLNRNDLQIEQVHPLEEDEDIINENSNNEAFQLEFLEDFDTPIEFDNGSFIPKSDLKTNGNIQHVNSVNTLNDPIADTSINNLQIEKKNEIENQNMSQMNLNEIVDDCNSGNFFSKNFAIDYQSSIEKNQDVNSMQPALPNNDMSLAFNDPHKLFSDTNEDPNLVRFKDLQNMSDSILSLSECEPPHENNLNTENNPNERLDKITVDIPNTALSTPVLETSTPVFEFFSEEIEKEDVPDVKSTLNDKTNLDMVSDTNSNEKLCKSTIFDVTPSNVDEADIKKPFNDEENNEMRAEASQPELKLYESMIPLLPNKNDKNSVDKHSNFLINFKSKLENLFPTTEKVRNIWNSPDDNTNESSNINPTIPKINKLTKLDNLQAMPEHTFRESSLPKLAGILVNPNNNKLAVANSANQPLRNNPFKFLNFPNEVSKAFDDDTVDPSLSLSVLSDRLRNHAENTIQDVKDTLEKTLKEYPSFRRNELIDTMDTHSVLKSISNSRDEMKEKLEAIQLDFNDRFRSFQQSVLDHFIVSPVGDTDFNNNRMLKESYMPMEKKIPQSIPSKFKNVINEKSNIPYRLTLSENRKNSETSMILPKMPIRTNAEKFNKSDRKPLLQHPLYSTTTTPPFTIRSKFSKSNIDSTPSLTSEKLSKAKSTATPILTENKINGLILKPGPTSKLSEEPYGLSSASRKTNLPVKYFKTNTEKNNNDHSSTSLPVNKFTNFLLRKNPKHKDNNEFTRHGNLELGASNSLDKNNKVPKKQESFLGRMKEVRPKIGSRNNDELLTSPTSHVDITHSSETEGAFQLVEPLKENVPYKCRLICYKDS